MGGGCIAPSLKKEEISPMESVKIGLIRVLTTHDEKVLNAHAELLKSYFSNFDIETRCIADQDEGIHDEETKSIAVPKILDLASEFERKGKDAIFVSCADDPAVAEAKNLLKIPVIGAGSACAYVALSIGNRIGTLGITEEAPAVMSKILGEKLIYNVKPERVNTTVDLMKGEGKENAIKAALILKEKGCDTLALSCTGMSTIGVADDLKQITKMRVIDPVLAAGTLLSYLRF